MTDAKAFAKGFYDYIHGGTPCYNPYNIITEKSLYSAYNRGWVAARNQSEALKQEAHKEYKLGAKYAT